MMHPGERGLRNVGFPDETGLRHRLREGLKLAPSRRTAFISNGR
jgi:hypothetical protein